MELYAAEIVDGLVVRVIVGTSKWATENLGGVWVETTTLPGAGWIWNEMDGFRPPPPPPPPPEE